MKFKGLLFSSMLLVMTVTANAGDRSLRCGKEKIQGISFEWCIDQANRQKNSDIIYFFHGLYGSEKTWTINPDFWDMRSEWDKLKFHYPTVISITFGRKWLFSDVDGRASTINYFYEQIMPFLEQKIGGLKSGKRSLMGRSMGGFNASQLMLHRPELWQKAALLCPAITEIGPFSERIEVDGYLSRTHAERERVDKIIDTTRDYFPSLKEWERHSPLGLAKNIFVQSKIPDLFISCGMQDHYGFFEAAGKLALLAQQNGKSAQWVPVQGEHCAFDIQKAAIFFTK